MLFHDCLTISGYFIETLSEFNTSGLIVSIITHLIQLIEITLITISLSIHLIFNFSYNENYSLVLYEQSKVGLKASFAGGNHQQVSLCVAILLKSDFVLFR